MKKKLSEYYEEYARSLGYKDWNTYCGLVSPNEKLLAKNLIKTRINRTLATRRYRSTEE